MGEGDTHVYCNLHERVEEQIVHEKENRAALWKEMRKRLPIWVFTLFAVLVLGLMGVVYNQSTHIHSAVASMGTDIAVIKAEIKHLGDHPR